MPLGCPSQKCIVIGFSLSQSPALDKATVISCLNYCVSILTYILTLPSSNTLFVLLSGVNTAHGIKIMIQTLIVASSVSCLISSLLQYPLSQPHRLLEVSQICYTHSPLGLHILPFRWTSQTPSVLADHLFQVSVYLLLSSGNFT